MKRFALLVSVLTVFACSPVAHADDLVFQVSGVANGVEVIEPGFGTVSVTPTFSGSLTIDTTDGYVVSGMLDLDAGSVGSYTLTYSDSFVDYGYEGLSFSDTGGDTGSLILPVSTLVGYNGGAICSVNNTCFAFGVSTVSGEFNVTVPAFTTSFATADRSGSLAASGNLTPEPSSLILLATGMAGCAGAVRRRIRRKA